MDVETLTMLSGDTLLGGLFSLFLTAMLGFLCVPGLWRTSGLGDGLGFALVLEVTLFLLSLFCRGFSSACLLLGTEELRGCVAVPSALAALIRSPSSLSFRSPVNPQLLLTPFGPDFGPEDEAGRAVAAGAVGVALGTCCDAESELLLFPADDDGREGVGVAGANLTTAGLLTAWTAAPASLSPSLMLRSEEVDMLSEEEDFLTSTDCNRLCGGKLGFFGFSMTVCLFLRGT